MIVDAVEARQLGAQPGDEIDARVGLAVAVGVAERREEWGMNDVKRPVDPLEPHHAPELVGEDRESGRS